MKNVWVTSCSHSQGWPIVRVTISKTTVVENPNSSSPQTIIRTSSRPSSARHFRWRCRSSTSLSAMRMSSTRQAAEGREASLRRGRLLDGVDQVLDLHRMGTKLLREPLLQRRSGADEARLVDVGDDLDADRLQLVRRLMLEVQRFGRLRASDFVGRRRHPLLLIVAQALPQLVADPDEVVVRLVL